MDKVSDKVSDFELVANGGFSAYASKNGLQRQSKKANINVMKAFGYILALAIVAGVLLK